MGLFGSELRVSDGFSKTFSSFASETKNAKSNMDGLKGSIKDAESSIGGFKSSSKGVGEEFSKAGSKASGGFKNAFKNIKSDGESTFKSLTNSVNNFSNSTLGMITKITAGYLSLKGAVGLAKKSIGDASGFQNAAVFLGATYGEQQGKEKYKWATKEANETPFSEKEVANGLARAHALNLKDDAQTFKMYEDLGSFAKVQGVGDLSSAIDAISDAKSGQWERLQTITGTKREQLESFAKDKGLGQFTNKKGQVIDSEKLMDVLQGYMKDKGISGMTDKFSKTFSGRMSTLQGNAEKSLAEMAGIKDDGTVKDGSLFDSASKGMEKLITSVNKFSKSESFDKIADGLGRLGNSIINGLDYVTEHPEVAEGIVKVGGALMGLKVASSVFSPISSLCGGIKTLGSLSGIISPGLSNGTAAATIGISSLTKGLGIAAVGFAALNSVISENGTLHKGINNVTNDMLGNTEGKQIDFINLTGDLFQDIGLSAQQGLANITGNEAWQKKVAGERKYIDSKFQTADSILGGAKFYSDDEKDKWYTGKKNSEWNTVPNMINSGAVTKNSTNNNVNNNYKTDVHLSVGTVRETADVDDIANQLATKLNKVFNTRNAIGYNS